MQRGSNPGGEPAPAYIFVRACNLAQFRFSDCLYASRPTHGWFASVAQNFLSQRPTPLFSLPSEWDKLADGESLLGRPWPARRRTGGGLLKVWLRFKLLRRRSKPWPLQPSLKNRIIFPPRRDGEGPRCCLFWWITRPRASIWAAPQLSLHLKTGGERGHRLTIELRIPARTPVKAAK